MTDQQLWNIRTAWAIAFARRSGPVYWRHPLVPPGEAWQTGDGLIYLGIA